MNTEKSNKFFEIIIADDDFDDFRLIRDTFEKNHLNVHLTHIEDGQYLIDILRAQSKNNSLGGLPQLILLDLNMPRKTGMEVLKEIKANSLLRRIPIIIFTTSRSSGDIEQSYELGASCYVIKPTTADGWVRTLGNLGRFWMEDVVMATNT